MNSSREKFDRGKPQKFELSIYRKTGDVLKVLNETGFELGAFRVHYSTV